MIEVRHLSKTFVTEAGDGIHAIQDVSLTIRDNEFLTILGPSGCGKTTLLRCIDGLISWDIGEILINGVPVIGPGPERAMVFQNFALMPWASALGNVTIGLEAQGLSKAECVERAQELLELVGLADFASRMPYELSGGMQQRVGLARALAVNPEILLMDEPFGALDEQTRRLLQEELLQIWESLRTTVVFITHSMEEAVLLSSRVALMTPRPGQIAEIIDVPMARPRSERIDSVEGSKELHEITGHLWARLRHMQGVGGQSSIDLTP